MFVTFEGIDGSGKSTQIERLAERLKERGIAFTQTREPGGTVIGKRIREILLDPAMTDFDPKAEMLLYLADRAQHLAEVIRPALARGEWVLCDRYHDATLAYQGHGRGLDLSWLESLAKDLILTPDLTLWFSIEPARAAKRLEERNKKHDQKHCRLELEELAFFERIHQGYRSLAAKEPERFLPIEADQSLEAVAAQVWERVSPHLRG